MSQELLVSEMFISILGEGVYVGNPAAFVRLYGCNAKCDFCDTKYAWDASEGKGMRVTVDEVAKWIKSTNLGTVVFTGGEPTLQVAALRALCQAVWGFTYNRIIETNGSTIDKFPDCLMTVSPKQGMPFVRKEGFELKIVYPLEGVDPLKLEEGTAFNYYSIQPLDVPDEKKRQANRDACVKFVLANPEWRLSVQVHKILGCR